MDPIEQMEQRPLRSLRERELDSGSTPVAPSERGRLATRIRGMSRRGAAVADVGQGLLLITVIGFVIALVGFFIRHQSATFINPKLRTLDVPEIAQAYYRPVDNTGYSLVDHANVYLAALQGVGGKSCDLGTTKCAAIDNATIYLRAQRDFIALQDSDAPVQLQHADLQHLIRNESTLGFPLRPRTMWALETRILEGLKSNAAKRAAIEARPSSPTPWASLFSLTALGLGLGGLLHRAGLAMRQRADRLGRMAREVLGTT